MGVIQDGVLREAAYPVTQGTNAWTGFWFFPSIS